MKTIALSAGHSNTDPGAIHEGLVERDLIIKITKYATDILKSYGIGVLNPPDDLSLTQTIKWINDRSQQIDCCCEVHINAGGGLGLEGWYYRGSVTSQNFAKKLIEGINLESGMSKTRGVKDEKFANIWHKLGFVHDTVPLACLIECGFIDRDEDRKILNNDFGLYSIGRGLARGIITFFGINYVGDKTKTEAEKQELIEMRKLLADIGNKCQSKSDLLKELSSFIILYKK